MKIHTTLPMFGTAMLVGALAAPASGAPFSINQGDDARVADISAGSRGDNNGGGNANLIGVAAVNSFENYALMQFDLSSLSGMTLTGDVTLTVSGHVDGSTANAGGTDDSVNVHELFLTNSGWAAGTGTIRPTDTETDDGSVSFLNFSQFNDDPGPAGGTTVAWQDAGGTNVGNLTGAFGSALDTVGGYDADTTLVFTIDQATAQGWIDNGLAGVVFTADEGGGATAGSRFVIGGDAVLSGDAVPEPGSLALLGMSGLALLRRRRA